MRYVRVWPGTGLLDGNGDLCRRGHVFGLRTSSNFEGRDEAIIWVPLERFPEVAEFIAQLGEDPEEWPWLDEEAEGREVEMAAEVLGLSPAALAEDTDPLELLRIE